MFLLVFTFLQFFLNFVVTSDLTNEPCGPHVLYQSRQSTEDNWWLGQLYLKGLSSSNNVKVLINVDSDAELIIDSKIGQIIDGAKIGKKFDVNFVQKEGENYASFTIKGLDPEDFPNLVSLSADGREICTNLDKWVRFRETFGLSPMLDKPEEPEDFGLSNAPKPSNVPRPQVVNKPALIYQPINVPSCGRRKVSNSQTFITSGVKSKPGKWPWHVAVFHRNHRASEYKCGGSLLNAQTIITAAHCCTLNGNALIADRVSVHLGRYDLNRFDGNSIESTVYEVIVHPQYDAVSNDHDLALLRLSEVVKFTQFIQPVCLWKSEQEDLRFVLGKNGNVVGWGINEKNLHDSVLNEATMPVVDFFTCLESDRDFFGLFLSQYNFCAGFRNGTSVCNGDSGGGMFFFEGETWYLRGLVSQGHVTEGTTRCNPRKFVIFTDVAKYISWIKENW